MPAAAVGLGGCVASCTVAAVGIELVNDPSLQLHGGGGGQIKRDEGVVWQLGVSIEQGRRQRGRQRYKTVTHSHSRTHIHTRAHWHTCTHTFPPPHQDAFPDTLCKESYALCSCAGLELSLAVGTADLAEKHKAMECCCTAMLLLLLHLEACWLRSLCAKRRRCRCCCCRFRGGERRRIGCSVSHGLHDGMRDAVGAAVSAVMCWALPRRCVRCCSGCSCSHSSALLAIISLAGLECTLSDGIEHTQRWC